jgi:VIT family
VASAFSMGASGYLAAQSQKEVDQNEINTQRAELLLWPEREQAYLESVYQEKGLTPDEAKVAAGRLMSDPDVALRELSREKLGISFDDTNPIREGVITGVSTIVGAGVPLVVRDRHAGALRRGRGSQHVHRAARVPLGFRHVHRGLGHGGGRVRGRVPTDRNSAARLNRSDPSPFSDARFVTNNLCSRDVLENGVRF